MATLLSLSKVAELTVWLAEQPVSSAAESAWSMNTVIWLSDFSAYGPPPPCPQS